MASSALALASPCCFRKPHQRKISPFIAHSLVSNGKDSLQLKTLQSSSHFRPPLAISPFSLTQTRAFSDRCLETADETERLMLYEEKPVKFALWVVFWASLSLAWFAFSKDANAAAADSIKASGFGLKIANSLRKLGLPDGVVVFTLATLPVLELRGAIPVGYWLQLNPATLTVLSILGLVLFFFYEHHSLFNLYDIFLEIYCNYAINFTFHGFLEFLMGMAIVWGNVFTLL